MQQRRRAGAALLIVVFALLRGPQSVGWLSTRGVTEASQESKLACSRRFPVALGLTAATAGTSVSPSLAEEAGDRRDELGRPVFADGSTVQLGIDYGEVASFNGRPKIFIAGSTGDLGRRVVLDLIRSGHFVYAGIRDVGRARECSYQNKVTTRYGMQVVPDVLVEGGREVELQQQLGDAPIVIDCAGARFGLDIIRLGVGLDQSEPERIDFNGTKALVDAAVAKGVKKFVYVSAILSNARELGAEVYESDAFKNWNNYGNVLEYKHEAEEYVRQSGLDYTIIRPAPMVNDFPRDVGGIWFGKPDTILLQSGEVGSKISRDDVSLACVDAVYNPKASRGTFELVAVPRRKPTPRDSWWVPFESGKAAGFA